MSGGEGKVNETGGAVIVKCFKDLGRGARGRKKSYVAEWFQTSEQLKQFV